MLNVIIDQVGKNLEIRTAVPCHIIEQREAAHAHINFGGKHKHACMYFHS